MKTIKQCRSCGSEVLEEVINLGNQRLADFRTDNTPSPKYPLEVLFCHECKLVQLRHSTPPYQMYHDRYGFKSGVNDTIKADLRDIVDNALQYIPDPGSWLDIASNDGTLLSFVGDHIYRVGIDPIRKLCREAEKHADLIINNFFHANDLRFYGEFDVITSISCFYDMDDPNKFVKEVRSVLAEDGVWIIQQNYLLTMLETSAIDNICHEHLEYYSLLSLENLLGKFDLEVVSVSTSMINGGVIRTIVGHKGQLPVDKSVDRQRKIESDTGLGTIKPYYEFNQVTQKQLKGLKTYVDDINKRGQKVMIYGASTRGGTIWQAAGLTSEDLPYAVERNPDKVGKWMSCIGSRIISEEDAHAMNPEYMLVSIWFFRDEVVLREMDYVYNGGKLIFPLPILEIVDA